MKSKQPAKPVKRPRLAEQLEEIIKCWVRGCFWIEWMNQGCPGDDDTLKALVKESA